MVYLANNWKIVLALQEYVMRLLKPFLNAQAAKSEAAARMAQKEADTKARKARAERLKAAQAS